MMQRVRFLQYLLLPLLLSGCFAVTVSDGRPGMYGDQYFLDSLVGETSEIVVRKFGIPDELLFDGQTRYMVYSTRGSGTSQGFILYIPLPVTPTDDDAIKHCLRFELDNDNLVKAYMIKSKSTSKKWIVFMPVGGGPVNCRDLFWTKPELIKLQMTTSFPSEWFEIVGQEKKIEEKRREKYLRQQEEEHRQQMEEFHQQAKKGNADAQLALFKELHRIQPEVALKWLYRSVDKGNADAQLALFKELHRIQPEVALTWLCRSADSGNQQARVILGNLLAYGRHAWIEQDIIERNYRLAYVWHGLSEQYDHEDLQFFADRYLTAEERLDAEKMLKEWQPGNCERELGFDGDELSNIN